MNIYVKWIQWWHVCETKTRTQTVRFFFFTLLCVYVCVYAYIIHTVSFRCLRRCLWQRRSFLTGFSMLCFLAIFIFLFYVNCFFLSFFKLTQNIRKRHQEFFFQFYQIQSRFTHFWNLKIRFVGVLSKWNGYSMSFFPNISKLC